MVENIAVVSDVHLKLRRDAKFELGRFNALIQHLADSDSSIIIFNGDLLDIARPTLEEIQALGKAFKTLSNKTIYLLNGNHEAVTKESSTYEYIPLPPNVEYVDQVKDLTINGINIRLVSWLGLEQLYDLKSVEILISHYRSKVDGLFDEEIETARFINSYGLCILGDIHFRHSPESHVHYTGSPYPVHYSKLSKDGYGYVELIINPKRYDWKYINLDLPKKIRLDIKASQFTNLKLNKKHLYKVHVTGTLDELSEIHTYPGMLLIKEIYDSNTNQQAILAAKDTNFFDSLTELVNNQMTIKTPKTKEILLKLQEG
jgi:DNA repair exonuclease SbcCD nuclease subunit